MVLSLSLEDPCPLYALKTLPIVQGLVLQEVCQDSVGFWALELTLSSLSHLQGTQVSWDKACWDVAH